MDEATHKKNFKPINLRDLFMDKNPGLGRWIPPFVFRHIKVLVNDLLTKVDNMEGTFVPVHKHGTQAMDKVRRINAIFESDEQVMTFPAGLVSRRKKGLIRDPEWQKSIIVKAKSSKRAILPIHVSGRCTNFFYNPANFRKFPGIKANLEMFLLPSESCQHRIQHFEPSIGNPIPYDTFDIRHTPLEWAQIVKDHVYLIAEDPKREFSYVKN